MRANRHVCNVQLHLSLTAHPALGIGKEWGSFTWNNHKLLSFKVSVLDPATASGSVVIWQQGVQGADGTDRL